jgi:hypothetical protein
MEVKEERLHSLIESRFGKEFSGQVLLAKEDWTVEIKTPQALAVYTTRFKNQETLKVGKPFTGYEALLENLAAYSEPSIRIHTFSTGNELHVFFTDIEVTKLIGTLSNARKY